jgi:hypothetical protein
LVCYIVGCASRIPTGGLDHSNTGIGCLLTNQGISSDTDPGQRNLKSVVDPRVTE